MPRTFATTGSRTEARFDFDGTSFHADVRAARKLESIEIVKRDRVAFRQEGPKLAMRLDWVDPEAPVTGDFYYLRVRETNGHMAWTSPIYFP